MITPVAVLDATTGAADFAGDTLIGAAGMRFSTRATWAREARAMVDPPEMLRLAAGAGAGTGA